MVGETWGVRGRPNGHYRRWTLNSHGFLGPEITREPPRETGSRRVMILGASETFGLYESKGQDYPSELAKQLKLDGKSGVEIVNAAVAGMTLPAMKIYWEQWASRFKPEIVLIYPSSHFYLSDEAPKPPVPTASKPVTTEPGFSLRFTERLVDQLRQFSLLRYLRAQWTLSKALDGKGPDYVFSSVPKDRLAGFAADLEQLATAVERTGARPVIVTHAFKHPAALTAADRSELGYFRIFFPRATPEVFPAFSAGARQATLDLAKRRGWFTIDAASELNGRRELFADPVHFNNNGSRQMARILANGLSPVLSSATAGQSKLRVQ